MKKLLDEKNERALLIALFVGALLLRLWFSLSIHKPADFIESDMWVYNHRAGHFIDRTGGPFDSFNPVGYPAMLALIYKIVGSRSYATVGVVQAFMGAATVTLTHLIARRMTSSYRVALISGVIVAVYPPLIFYGALCLTELPSCFLLMLSSWALMQAIDRTAGCVDEAHAISASRAWHPWAWIALSAVSFSIGIAMRPNLALFFPMLPLFVWVMLGRDVRRTAEFTAKYLGFMLPVLIATSMHMSALRGKFVLVSSNGGLNFFLAHTEFVGARWKDPTGYMHWIVPVPNKIQFKDFYESPVPLYDESHFYQQAFALIRERPFRLVASLNNIVEGIGLGRQVLWPGWKDHNDSLGVIAHAFAWVVWPVVTLYFVAMSKGRRWLEVADAPRLLVFLHVAALVFTVYTFLGDPRMRVPLDPLLIVLFVDALSIASGWVAKRRSARVERPGEAAISE